MNKRKVEGSQEEYRALTSTVPQERYCRGCILVPGCNVLLKEGESCGDKYDFPRPVKDIFTGKVTTVYGPPVIK